MPDQKKDPSNLTAKELQDRLNKLFEGYRPGDDFPGTEEVPEIPKPALAFDSFPSPTMTVQFMTTGLSLAWMMREAVRLHKAGTPISKDELEKRAADFRMGCRTGIEEFIEFLDVVFWVVPKDPRESGAALEQGYNDLVGMMSEGHQAQQETGKPDEKKGDTPPEDTAEPA